MNKEIQNISYIVAFIFLTYMCFTAQELKMGFIICLLFILIMFIYNYYKTSNIELELDFRIKNNCLEIINKQKSITIPISDIKYCESIISACNSTYKGFGYGLSITHEFIIHTKTKTLHFKFPEKIQENYLGVIEYAEYDEVFDLFDLDLPNYKCNVIGNVDYIKKDIEYYSTHHKKQNLIVSCYLYFLSLPLSKKIKYIICMLSLILVITYIILLIIIFPLNTFIQEHGIFF